MELEDYCELLPKMEVQERIMLGFMMLDQEAVTKVIVEAGIDRRCFHFAETRAVFIALETMFNAGLKIDGAEVIKFMIDTKTVREINGISTINDYLVCAQYIERQTEEYNIDYLINLITAQFEFREMHFLIDRYDFNFEGGADHDQMDQ